MRVQSGFAKVLGRGGAAALRLATWGVVFAATPAALGAQGGLQQAGPEATAQLEVDLVLIPEEGQTTVQEVTVFDYLVDMEPMIQAGYPVVWPDLPVRAFRDAADDIQMILPVSGLNQFVGNQVIGGNVRLIGSTFDTLAPCIGGSCKDRCIGEECLVMRSDALDPSCYFDDAIWLSSVYRDGSTIYAVAHNEYEAQSRSWADFPLGQPPECDSCKQEHLSCCNGVPRVFGLDITKPGGHAAADVYCQHTIMTFARSTDGGATFQQANEWGPGPHPDLVAHGPYPFIPDKDDHLCLSDPMDPDSPKVTCPYSGTPYGGFAQPSNIVQHPEDGYYYMITRQHLPPLFLHENPGPEQLWAEVQNAVIMRTDDLSDPTSWRGWGGSFDALGDPIYDVDFLDPYRSQGGYNAIDHVAYPLNPYWQYAGAPGIEDTIGNFSGSLTWNSYLNKWVLIDSAPFLDENNQPAYGVFFALSDDLVQWSERKLTDPPITRRLQERHLYPALIDHDCPTDNFDRAGRRAFLYIQRSIPGYYLEGDVVRVRAEFQFTGK